jgi:hypothetical protein
VKRRHGLVELGLAGLMLIVTACGGTASAPSATRTAPGDSSAVPKSTSAAHVVTVPDACALTDAGELGKVLGYPFFDGQDVTAEVGWTTSCAWVESVYAGESPYNVNIRALADGTLIAFSKMAGSKPITGLADEAYVLDDGRQIAMRFGSVVVLLAGARGLDGKGISASALGVLAEIIASRLEAG